MCSNIVDFPGAKPPKKTRRERFTVEQIEPQGYVPVARLDFTCPTCHNETSLTFNNMIFKNMQFYCGKCGSGWKVNNKLFCSNATKDKAS